MTAKILTESLLDISPGAKPLAEGEDSFVTQLDRKSLSVDHAGDYELEEAQATVHWRADHDYRSWGIKEIAPVIERFTGSLVFRQYETNEQREVDLSQFQVTAEFETHVERHGLSLYPRHVEVNLEERAVVVFF